jgi:EAL domain-containing protein (putative c-di-GMP-specific phosphodiesterase class I)
MDLRHAIERGELELYYQPIWSLAHHKLAGFEALLRWNHSQLGQISPAEFIPIAEETGMIIQIGEWVLGQACSDAAKWPNDLRIAVNVSPIQFKGELLDQSIAQTLQKSGLAPNRLEIEITEGVLLTNTDRTLCTLKQIRDLGVSISIDDFGTGYASLGYLTQFTFDTLKIDGSFVRAASTEKNAQAVMRTIATLGKSLGVTTVAEGIEQKEQLELARDFGCDEIQGYIISRPQPIENFAGMIAESDKDIHWAEDLDSKRAS